MHPVRPFPRDVHLLPGVGRGLLLAGAALLAIGCDSDVGSASDPLPAPAGDAFVLNFAGTPDAATMSPVVAARQDGSRFAVAAALEPSALLVFDGEGTFLEAIGRRGEGPGELETVSALAFDATDSLWVFQPGRADVWSPEFEFVRTVALGHPIHDVTPARGRAGFLIAGRARAGGGSRVNVSLLTPDGDLVPLRDEPGGAINAPFGTDLRHLAGTGHGYWVARFQDWHFLHATFEGDTLAHLVDAPGWWSTDRDEELEQQMDSSPSILDMGVDTEGRLWILGGIPDLEMAERIQAGTADGWVIGDVVDHVIRIQDGDDVVSERRFDYFPVTFLTPELGSVTVPAGDSVQIAIHRLEGIL